jgi:hypothetical protein
MIDNSKFAIANYSSPPLVGTGNSSNRDLDYTLYKLSEFFQLIIQTRLTARWNEEVALLALSEKTNKICDQIELFPVHPYLQSNEFQFPLLNVYESNFSFKQITSSHYVISRNIEFFWIMFPLTIDQYRNLGSFLSAVRNEIVDRLYNGYDSNINSGHDYLKDTKISELLFVKGEIVGLPGATSSEANVIFPTLHMTFQVNERNQFVPGLYPPLEAVDGYFFTSSIDGYVEVAATTTIMAPSIASIFPTSGPITGKQLVTVTGNAFFNVTGGSLEGLPLFDLEIIDNNHLKFTTPANIPILASLTLKFKVDDPVTLEDCYQYIE